MADRLWTLADAPRPPIAWGNVDDLAGQATAARWPSRGTQGGAFTQENGDWTPPVSADGLASSVPGIMFGGQHTLEIPVTLEGPIVSVFALCANTGDGGKRIVSLNAHNADYNDDRYAAVVKSSGNNPSATEIERNGTTTTGSLSIRNPCLINNGFDGANPFTRVNGVADTLGNPDTRPLAPTFITLGGWYLFGSSPVDCFTGPVSDVAVFDYDPSGDVRDRIVASMLWARKQQAQIPAANPYRSAAPTVSSGGGGVVVPKRRRAMTLLSM